jgi:hypothetical protein
LEKTHNLNALANTVRIIKSRMMRWAGRVACIGRDKKKKNAYRIFLGKLEGKRPLGTPICRVGG